jgi:hypothetical protein
MRAAPTYLGRAGGELAKERLTQYLRYASLVAEQELALDEEDVERFNELGKQIADLREELGPAGLVDETSIDSEAEVHETAQVLRQTLVVNQRIQARLATMRHDNAGQIRELARRRPQARHYVAEQEAPETHLDVTL